MLTKIKESFLRAWRGEESFKTVLKVWGGSGLIVGFSSIILFFLFALAIFFFLKTNHARILMGFISLFGTIYIYLSLILIQRNLKFKSLVYNLAKYLFFIICYILMLFPLSVALYLFYMCIKHPLT